MNTTRVAWARSRALRIVHAAPHAVLATADAQGLPHVRWISSLVSFDGLQRLCCLTPRQGRKVEHLRTQPRVTWLFLDEPTGHTLTLRGEARIVVDAIAVQEIWDRMISGGRHCRWLAWASAADLPMAVLESDIHQVELLAPDQEVEQPLVFSPHEAAPITAGR